MRLEDFPRPRDDNGRGIHWSPSPYPPAGRALDYWVNELHALHMRWVKVVDDGRGTSVPLCRRLVAEGFMPIVRIERHRPHPHKLSRQEKEAIHRLVDAGVRYFEIDHRPDLPAAWGEGMPPNWFEVLMDCFVEDADFVLTAGGLPAIPAMVPHPHRNPVKAILQRGRKDLFDRGLWWAVHAYTLNRPLEYPDEEVHRTGKPVAPEEYRAHYPWGWNEPPEVINQWRAEGTQPESTVLDDPHCFRVFEVAGEWAEEALGHPIPVIVTEGGAVTGWRDDRRYPRLDPWTAAEWTVRIIRFLQAEAPPWLFAVCHWLLADQRMHPARPHAWESHCWYTHYWDKQFGFQGELPVVARVKAEPSQPRDLSAARTPPKESVFRFYKPEEPSVKEAEMARPGHIVGSVRDAERRPVVGVTVALEADDHVVAETRTDAEGKVRFDSVPPGVYRIHLPGHGHVEAVQVLPGEVTEFALVLREAVSEGVTILAAEGEAPSPGGPAGTGRIVGHVPGGRAGLPVRAIAPDGRTWETTLGPDERFRLEGLPAGTFELVLEGIGTMVSELTLEEDEEVEVYFPMRGVIQGLVLGGTPATLVELHAQTYGWSRKVALSPQGQYRFVGLPAGTYVVRVGDRALDPVTLTGEEIQTLPPLDLRPPHRAAVRGRVRDAQGDVLPDVVVQLLRRGQVVAETRTALNGTFMFVQMPPGEYQLIVRTEPEIVRTVFLEQDHIVEYDITVPSTEPVVTPIPPLPSGEVSEVEPATPEEEDEETAEPEGGQEPSAAEAPEPAPQPAAADHPAPASAPAKPFETYVLLPPPDHPFTRAVILAALPFLRRTAAVAGFSPEEAQHARRVLIVGDETVYGPNVASMLEEAGCEVDRVSADPVTLMPLFRMFLPEAGG